ncbi:MAG: nucleoside triphosphate pyrophosphatase [Myxococcales bacterium]|nr:Maf family protein [Myxococcales bacterium]
MQLVLCSASPRRKELLARAGVRFTVTPSHIDETLRPGESALGYVRRMAVEKAAPQRRPGQVALAADTIVVVDGDVLGKPRDRSDAQRMLAALSGREHRVITAVCVNDAVREVETAVWFARLTSRQLAFIVDSGDGDDKAGAYAVQGVAGAFITAIDGSFSNVIGLPMAETLDMLAQAGVELPWT